MLLAKMDKLATKKRHPKSKRALKRKQDKMQNLVSEKFKCIKLMKEVKLDLNLKAYPGGGVLTLKRVIWMSGGQDPLFHAPQPLYKTSFLTKNHKIFEFSTKNT